MNHLNVSRSRNLLSHPHPLQAWTLMTNKKKPNAASAGHSQQFCKNRGQESVELSASLQLVSAQKSWNKVYSPQLGSTVTDITRLGCHISQYPQYVEVSVLLTDIKACLPPVIYKTYALNSCAPEGYNRHSFRQINILLFSIVVLNADCCLMGKISMTFSQ